MDGIAILEADSDIHWWRSQAKSIYTGVPTEPTKHEFEDEEDCHELDIESSPPEPERIKSPRMKDTEKPGHRTISGHQRDGVDDSQKSESHGCQIG